MNKLTTTLFLLFSIFCFSQNETSNWHFGDKAALKFAPLSDPTIINTSNINAIAGCASISDNEGNLKLYTNGETIWGPNNLIIYNGTNKGDKNGAQNSIIINHPSLKNLYYVFFASNKGVYYVLIDTINFSIIEDKKIVEKSCGKISAVHHSDGESVWVLVLGEDNLDTFSSFKIDTNGISENPIKSSASTSFLDTKHNGYLKFSPNGKIIAAANKNLAIELYDFDPSNGSVSNYKHLSTRLPHPYERENTYGIEFSQDSKFLYSTSVITYKKLINGKIKDTYLEFLVQFDLKDSSAIFINREIINMKDLESYHSSIQLALNGFIYKTNSNGEKFVDASNKLSAILSPSEFGLKCNYKDNVVLFNDNKITLGLPNFITSYFRSRILIKDNCVSDFFNFAIDTYAPITSISWEFGDGNTSNILTPQHKYTTPGTYNVKAIITINNNKVELNKEVTVFPLPVLNSGQDLKQCDIDNDGISLFDLNIINDQISTSNKLLTFTFYRTLEDAEKDQNKIATPDNFYNESNPQTIYAKATNSNGCSSIESFTIETLYKPALSLSPMITCEESDNKADFDLRKKRDEIINTFNIPSSDKISFYLTKEDAQKQINELSNRYNSSSTTIWVRIQNNEGCSGISPLELIVNKLPVINLEDTYTICINPLEHTPIVLMLDGNNDKFEWRNDNGDIININNQLTLTNTGNYSVTVYKTTNGVECSNSFDFEVINPLPPKIVNIDVDSENENDNSIYVSVNGNSTYEFSLDNINYFGNGTSYTFDKVPAGVNTVYVRDTKKCEAKIFTDVSVIGYPKFLSPNGDGKNDFWTVYGIKSSLYKKINITIFNRFGKVLYTITDKNAEQGWNGTFNGKILPPNDYWFHAKLIDLKGNIIEKKSNFSLQQN